MELELKEAKEIIRAGFAWANWTANQKQAFKLAYECIDKVERYEKALKNIAENNEDTSCNEIALKYEVIADKALNDLND
jgi:hypothetical protein